MEIAPAAAAIREWKACPPKFVRRVFRATPDQWQDDILEAFPNERRIALKACVGPGKTALLAWLILNFLATRLFPKIAATSITWPNLRDNLWAELAKWIRASEFLSECFTWTQTKVFSNEAPEEWWCSARTWDRSGDPEQQGQTLSGLHAQNVMAVADESGGIPDAVIASAEGVLATGGDAKVVQAGNPTHLSGPLHRACNADRAMWFLKEITGDPDHPDRAPRVSVKWAREMIQKYGRNSAYVRSKVLGLFPRQATDALISLDWFEDAYGRTCAPDNVTLERGLKTLGVDVARFGDDETDIAKRDGCFHEGFESWRGKDTEYTADRVDGIAREHGAEEVRVDDIGVGGGVTDKLKRRSGSRYEVHGVNVSVAPTKTGPDKEPLYANLKAQLNLEMQQKWFKPGLISLHDSIRETDLSAQGTDIRYGFGRGGRVFQVETKDEYRKRHNGQSPDKWDATVLAYAELDVAFSGFLDLARKQLREAEAKRAEAV